MYILLVLMYKSSVLEQSFYFMNYSSTVVRNKYTVSTLLFIILQKKITYNFILAPATCIASSYI